MTIEEQKFELTKAALTGILADHCDIDCVPGKTCTESMAILAVDAAEETLRELYRRQK